MHNLRCRETGRRSDLARTTLGHIGVTEGFQTLGCLSDTSKRGVTNALLDVLEQYSGKQGFWEYCSLESPLWITVTCPRFKTHFVNNWETIKLILIVKFKAYTKTVQCMNFWFRLFIVEWCHPSCQASYIFQRDFLTSYCVDLRPWEKDICLLSCSAHRVEAMWADRLRRPSGQVSVSESPRGSEAAAAPQDDLTQRREEQRQCCVCQGVVE